MRNIKHVAYFVFVIVGFHRIENNYITVFFADECCFYFLVFHHVDGNYHLFSSNSAHQFAAGFIELNEIPANSIFFLNAVSFFVHSQLYRKSLNLFIDHFFICNNTEVWDFCFFIEFHFDWWGHTNIIYKAEIRLIVPIDRGLFFFVWKRFSQYIQIFSMNIVGQAF